MAIAFARPTLFNYLSSRYTTTRTVAAPPTQSATIVRPYNPLGTWLPLFRPTLPPPIKIAPPVSPVVVAAPAPPPVPAKPEAECQTCKGGTTAPAPAPTLSLVEGSAPAPETPAPTPATPPAKPGETRSKGKVVGFVIAAGVLLALLVYGSTIRPR